MKLNCSWVSQVLQYLTMAKNVTLPALKQPCTGPLYLYGASHNTKRAVRHNFDDNNQAYKCLARKLFYNCNIHIQWLKWQRVAGVGAQDEATKVPRTRRSRRRRGGERGGGIPTPSDRGSGGMWWAPPAGSGVEPQPKMNLVYFICQGHIK